MLKNQTRQSAAILPGLLLPFIVAAVAKVLALWLPQLGRSDFGDFY